jgi:DNA-binding NarL/FixJ family response regulator
VRGRTTKEIAGEIGVADVTGAVLVVSAIRRLGLRSRVELTEVDCTDDGSRCHGAWRLDIGEERYVLFETSLRRLRVPACVSHAEREVVQGVLEGFSNTDIARSRRTSCRTVANQLSSIYWKLGISGRAELIETCSRPEAAVRSQRVATVGGRLPAAGWQATR